MNTHCNRLYVKLLKFNHIKRARKPFINWEILFDSLAIIIYFCGFQFNIISCCNCAYTFEWFGECWLMSTLWFRFEGGINSLQFICAEEGWIRMTWKLKILKLFCGVNLVGNIRVIRLKIRLHSNKSSVIYWRPIPSTNKKWNYDVSLNKKLNQKLSIENITKETFKSN